MKAMILAAGLGTRLRPLTNDRPKALVELNGRTLLEITIARLASFGVDEFIVNVHHFADQVADYLKSKNNFGFRIELSREDDLLLDTGGGLKKASWFFLKDASHLDEAFVLHNVDVISNIDLNAMLQFHKDHQALATLAVQSRESSRQLLFNNALQLSGRRIHNTDTVISSSHPTVISSEARNLSSASSNAQNPHSPLATSDSPLPPSQNPSPLLPLAFTGIHVLSPRLLPMLTESAPVFSIIDSYLRLSSQSQRILAFRADTSYWRDLGKPADLAQAALDLRQNTSLS
ncbi:MAG: sugar phosphate nucleotidyltransferase [Candidatus Acidiferrum sp.]